MTFTAIVAMIAADLDRTSASALTRIGTHVNAGYKRVCTDPFIGIDTISEVLGVEVMTVIGNQELTWGSGTTTPSTNVEKILRVYDPASDPPRPLFESSVDELQHSRLTGDPATRWAHKAMGASSVTVLLDSEPATSYALQADVMANIGTLSGSQVPAFAESYHDMLVFYGKWQELKKMQNYAGARQEEIAFHGEDGNGGRLAQLRLFIALSSHKKVYSGKNREGGVHISARI